MGGGEWGGEMKERVNGLADMIDAWCDNDTLWI